MISVEQCADREVWDNEVLDRGGHPMQLWGWGEVKAAHNWQVCRLLVRDDNTVIGLAQVLLRPLPVPFRGMAYIPRGPVVEAKHSETVLDEVVGYIKQNYNVVSLTVEPDWEAMPEMAGWKQTPNSILMSHTLILDLTQSEDELLSHMTKKTRQYIRKSEKSGVEIRKAKNLEDVAVCMAIYKQTAARAGFALHEDAYYEDIFTNLGPHSQIFMALYQGRVLAFLWLAVSTETAFELYGGMSEEGQELRANYILKWEAIKRMKAWGVRRYDMNGLLNEGVSKFKEGFASHETHLAGSFDKPLSPLYPLWTKGLPAAKKIIRTIKK